MTVHLEKYKEDGVTISLLLTEACTFACRHCMYECSPKSDPVYMGDDMLYKVKQQVDLLQDLEIKVIINLIGGEPTMDMEKFAHVLNIVGHWPVDLEMTTNGWWLADSDATKRFMEIMAPYVEESGRSECMETGDRISVRISNDPYHNEFRPHYLTGAAIPYYATGQGDKLHTALEGIWEDGTLFDEEVCVCPECGEKLPDGYCEDCGVDGEYEFPDEDTVYAPPPDSSDPWIHVEPFYTNTSGIAPNGRGVGVSTMSDSGSKGSGGVTFLTYLPDGRLMDVCGRGSWCEFGTVDDSPIFLAEVTKEFFRQREDGSGCWDCRFQADLWRTDHLEETRKAKAHLNTFDADELLEQPDVLEEEPWECEEDEEEELMEVA
jgi:hypothetical protein